MGPVTRHVNELLGFAVGSGDFALNPIMLGRRELALLFPLIQLQHLRISGTGSSFCGSRPPEPGTVSRFTGIAETIANGYPPLPPSPSGRV